MADHQQELERLQGIISLLSDLLGVLSEHKDEGVTIDGVFERISTQARVIKMQLEVEFENHPLRNPILSSLEGVADQFHPEHLDQIRHYIERFEQERLKLRVGVARARVNAVEAGKERGESELLLELRAAEAKAQVARAAVAIRVDAAIKEAEKEQGNDESP